MSPLENYLQNLYANHVSGSAVDETSGYGALQNLLNEIGKGLKPRVRAIIGLKNQGAGMPDGGLFTPDQFQKKHKGELIAGQMPSRGCIEVKPVSQDIDALAESEQVAKYLSKYGQVLLTNYNDFLLVSLDRARKLEKRERFSLSTSESEFWDLAAHPSALTHERSERCIEYLKRVMLHAAPLTEPKDLAWFLASYARDARIRIESSELPALKVVREALEEALGLRFEGEKGQRFFRSTFIQTLFYGIFSAWVLWSKNNPQTKKSSRFNWHEASWSLHVPMIKTLFEQVATESKLKPLNLVEVLNWTGDVLNRVDRSVFFANFEESHAVQYFYEPFLQAFDPELRKELGVWYTPIELVKYMVARVDTVLREELEIVDGLADPRVYVLDPSCGTGAYLVEVLHKIHETLKEKGEDALAANDLKEAAMKRVFGFEILPAPFVVSHLQLGLVLQSLGAPLKESTDERVGVYLTNALTGWEPAKGPKTHLLFPELEEERDRADDVKREKPILVILGNPPYNAFAGISPKEEQGLVEPYKKGLISDWGIKKFNLDDLYIRFFRLAERRIGEKTGKGVISFISNHSWVSDPSFVVMRKHLLQSFDKFWIENMHGNRKISEYAPDGKTSETVFAISGFSAGIQQGVAISLWVKNGKKVPADRKTVLFRDDLDDAKASNRRARLLETLGEEDLLLHYAEVHPNQSNRYSFRPSIVASNYLEWPKLKDLCEVRSDGLFEKRAGALIDLDRNQLELRMRKYYDPKVDWNSLESLQTGLTRNAARFNAKNARSKVLAAEKFNPENLRRYIVRPFDVRWCYFSAVRPLWNEPRPILWRESWAGNGFIVSRLTTGKTSKGSPLLFTRNLVDGQAISVNPSAIPIRTIGLTGTQSNQGVMFGAGDGPDSNLTSPARNYLSSIGVTNPDVDETSASLLWMHALAIGYSPAYLAENADGIRQDWPRIPLPSTNDVLLRSAELGRKIAALLDTEAPVVGVTSGAVNQALKSIGKISKVSGALVPEQDLKITSGWGHAGKAGVTMPGKGKLVTRKYTSKEREAIDAEARNLGLTTEAAFANLGETTADVYLNDVAYWENIPARVWE